MLQIICRCGEIGRRKGLKIPRAAMSVPVQVRPSAPKKSSGNIALFFICFFVTGTFVSQNPCLVTLESSLAIPSQAPYKSSNLHQSRAVETLLFFICFSLPALLFHKTRALWRSKVLSLFRRKLLTSPATCTKEEQWKHCSFFICFLLPALLFHKNRALWRSRVLSLFRRKLLTSPATCTKEEQWKHCSFLL